MNYWTLLTLILLLNQVQAQLPTYAPTSNLEGFYSFSGNVLDNSGNGHNSASYNIITTTDRNLDPLKALYFSGNETEFLNYGDVDAYEPYIATFSFWILPEEYGASDSTQVKPIISKWGAPGDLTASSYTVFMDGIDLCFALTDGIAADTLKTPLTSILMNQWSHVVITINYGFIKFYVNNALVTDTSSPISAFNNTNSEFKVGGWYQDINPNFSSFTGKIDDLGIWSRELDACEVAALYTGVACPTSGISELMQTDKEVVKIIDFMGREVRHTLNTPLIYVYSDGTRERVMQLED